MYLEIRTKSLMEESAVMTRQEVRDAGQRRSCAQALEFVLLCLSKNEARTIRKKVREPWVLDRRRV